MNRFGAQYLRDVEARKLRHLRVLARALGITVAELRQLHGDTHYTPPTKPRGFAAMTPEKQRQISALGGRAAINRRRFTPEQARAAWRKRDGLD